MTDYLAAAGASPSPYNMFNTGDTRAHCNPDAPILRRPVLIPPIGSTMFFNQSTIPQPVALSSLIFRRIGICGLMVSLAPATSQRVASSSTVSTVWPSTFNNMTPAGVVQGKRGGITPRTVSPEWRPYRFDRRTVYPHLPQYSRSPHLSQLLRQPDRRQRTWTLNIVRSKFSKPDKACETGCRELLPKSGQIWFTISRMLLSNRQPYLASSSTPQFRLTLRRIRPAEEPR